MKLYSLTNTPFTPVSHDPSLKKKVMVSSGVLPGIRHISHIILEQGSKVSVHGHEDASEVFYCVRGTVLFRVGEEDIRLDPDHLLVIDPGESHSIKNTPIEAELIYFLVESVHGQDMSE